MKDLLYFESEKIICWVAGYTADGSTPLALQKAKALQELAHKFANRVGVHPDLVRTEFITKSRRYKYMRVFFAELEKDKAMAADAFMVDNPYWNMFKWLED